MAKRPSNDDPRKYLSAFADGELDVEDSLRVLEHMTMHPNATRRVMHQQQLRHLVSESMQRDVSKAPEALRDAVLGIADASDREAEPATPRVLARIRPWVPAAVAAVLLIAASLLYFAPNNDNVAHPGEQARVTAPVASEPSAYLVGSHDVNRMTRRHVTCTRQISALSTAVKFPDSLQEMPQAISGFLNVAAQNCPSQLDLTSIGYRFAGAGPCYSPGGKSVHLVYQPLDATGPQDAVSLWVQPMASECSFSHIEPGKVYQATTEDSAHPLLVWRQNGMMYYLVGDSPQTVKSAADVLLVRG